MARNTGPGLQAGVRAGARGGGGSPCGGGGGRTAIGNAVRGLAECANRVADSLSELGYDHAGPLYHKILGSAKSDGAFYTNNVSAVLLARLALTQDMVDWPDPAKVEGLRIMDPACGTGTLLMAALQTIKTRVAEVCGDEEGKGDALHKTLVERVLCGLDINQHAVQLAACNVTLGAPTVDYQRMNLVTMPHGPLGDGEVRAGSLEILDAAEETELTSLVARDRKLDALDAEQVGDAGEIEFPLKNLDMVIMNPPFTDGQKRSKKFSREVKLAMLAREGTIKTRLATRDWAAGELLTTKAVRIFFTPLADRLLDPSGGTLATVMPVTGCIAASGMHERRFLADRFHIERIVTTHDPKNIAFSGNTGIHECLLICRRHPHGEDRLPTEFVSLRKMPEDARAAAAVADAIAAGRGNDVGRVRIWPAERVRAADWAPAQWYDGEIAEILAALESNEILAPSGEILKFGSTGAATSFSWVRAKKGSRSQTKIFDSVSSKLRQTMFGDPELLVEPGGTRPHLHENVMRTAGHLMLAARYNTVSGRSTALISRKPAVGFGWIPAICESREYEQAVCAWWNSTPGRMLLLNRRTLTLTYPKWSMRHIRSMPIPKPNTSGAVALTTAWAKFKETPLLPLRDGERCEARRSIDAAASEALGVDPEIVADWRRRLATEPTISNRRADDPVTDSAGET